MGVCNPYCLFYFIPFQIQPHWGITSDSDKRVSIIVFKLLKLAQFLNWSERSACAALGRCCGTKCPLYLVFFFFFSFCATYFSP